MKPGASAFLLAMSISSAAHAHGRVPSLSQIVFDPSNADHIVVQSTWGFITTYDRGASFTWQCADAVYFDRTQEDPSLVLFASGVLLAGTFSGIARSDASACSWGGAADGPTGYVIDLARDPSDPGVAIALESPGSAPDQLWRSDNEGGSWSRFSLPGAALFDRVRFAPSDPHRVYLSGVERGQQRRAIVLRSEDGGSTFRTFSIGMEEGETTARIALIDPLDPDRLFVRMVRRTTDTRRERLMRSLDGGESFERVLERMEIVGVASSSDGRVVWAGSWSEGLHRSEDGGATFSPLDETLGVRCLASRVVDGGDELWVGLDGFSEVAALARSVDRGETLIPVWSHREVRNDSGCTAETPVGQLCPSLWSDLRFDLMLEPEEADAGSLEPSTVTPSQSCACIVGARRSSAHLSIAGATILAVTLALRRRSRRDVQSQS